MARKQRTGVVVSDKMEKTVIVQVERRTAHPKYHKILVRRKRFQAHDETNVCSTGDRVVIEECRPLSRHKQWRVVRIMERHDVAEVKPHEIDDPGLDADQPAVAAAPGVAEAPAVADAPAVAAAPASAEAPATPADEASA